RQPNPHRWWQLWESDTTDIKVTVTPDFPTSNRAPVFARLGDNSADGPELWPVILEKAYAQYRGGYDGFKDGGAPAEGLQALTGRESDLKFTSTLTFDELYGDWKDGKPIATNTLLPANARTNPLFHADAPIPQPLISWHVYYVTGMDSEHQTITIKIRGPA